MTAVKIGAESVGDGEPCYIVAEIGINHNGDLAQPKRFISAAIAGVAAGPADAHFTALERATLRTRATGGNGAVRELLDQLAKADRLTLDYGVALGST